MLLCGFEHLVAEVVKFLELARLAVGLKLLEHVVHVLDLHLCNGVVQECRVLGSEVSALEAAMGEYGVGESTIVTMDAQEEITTQTGVVRVVPAWKWLLD